LYFPFSITEEQAPLKTETPLYDFTNVGGTSGPWVIRDPYAPAWLNFANLYYDRKRLIDLIGQFDGRPFKVFDRRRSYSFLPWEELNRVIRQSRLMVCTGGLHQNSVPKFLEYACLGVPMIGAGVPFEFPWLDQCLFTVDAMNISAAELKLKLAEALELQPKLRDNCLALRETLLKMYHPQTLLEMAQEQIDGKPIRPGYLKASAVI
jgi:glycosyltransferase involved in cell wall biosynthesis